ncbi:MAG: D-alanyl-D-alanine carboxypeptidase [Dehalococcoidia bacterium]|nr:D-alanyl-D-alanine carboxypeptidase [Dehalococcoidia bacterium]
MVRRVALVVLVFALAGAVAAACFAGEAGPREELPEAASGLAGMGVDQAPGRLAPGGAVASPSPGASGVPATPAARPPVSLGAPPPAVEAAAVLVFEPESGAALHAANEHARLAPASLTKIATAMVVLESGIDLDAEMEVHPDLEGLWLEDSTTMGLEPGDRLSPRELLYGLMLASGNDAARELATLVAGSEPAFVARMNALAVRLGLRDTHFTDATGLGGAGHYSSAWDMALLSRAAMELPAFREIVGTETHTTSGSRPVELYNFNPVLNYPPVPGVDGVKTGYTEEAGNTFVVSATREGRRLVVVILNGPYWIRDAIALLEWGYANHRWE